MFNNPNHCYLYLGLLKCFTGTLGEVIVFCLCRVSWQVHKITICCGWNILSSCLFLFLLVQIEFVVNVYYRIAHKVV